LILRPNAKQAKFDQKFRAQVLIFSRGKIY
jgi:hypothetical protein